MIKNTLLQIKHATTDGELIKDVEIERTFTVRLLKELIRRETREIPGWENFEPQNQRLIFGGGLLGGGLDDKVLNEIRNLANNSVVQLVYRPVERNAEQGWVLSSFRPKKWVK